MALSLTSSRLTLLPFTSPPLPPKNTKNWTASMPCRASHQTARTEPEKESSSHDLIRAVGKSFIGFAATAAALAPVSCDSPPAFANSLAADFPASHAREVVLSGVDASSAVITPVGINEGTRFLEVEGKKAWPELVGVKGKVAAAIIEEENPNVYAQILPEGFPAITNYVPSRVRVWVDRGGFVIQTPKAG